MTRPPSICFALRAGIAERSGREREGATNSLRAPTPIRASGATAPERTGARSDRRREENRAVGFPLGDCAGHPAYGAANRSCGARWWRRHTTRRLLRSSQRLLRGFAPAPLRGENHRDGSPLALLFPRSEPGKWAASSRTGSRTLSWHWHRCVPASGGHTYAVDGLCGNAVRPLSRFTVSDGCPAREWGTSLVPKGLSCG